MEALKPVTLTPGMRGEATTIVSHQNTAAALRSGAVEVFATPMMIALMEAAASQAIAGALQEGDITVGTMVHVRHLAASPIGQRVRATAELTEVNGRRLLFTVEAYDEKKKIGEGQHERFIVNRERFLANI